MPEMNTETMNDAEVAQLRDEFSKLKTDLREFLDTAKDLGLTRADSTGSRIRDILSSFNGRAKDSMGQAYEAAREEGQRAVQVGRETMEKKPYTVLLASFVAGVIVGRVLIK